MKKIIILGCGGAGKSTLAAQLGRRLNIPVYHLDSIFWGPNWKPADRQKFIQQQKSIMKNPKWIMDGNYGSTMDLRLQYADTIIFLHYRTIRCLYRITKRRVQYHGKTRPDMGEDCPEKLDWEFVSWVWKFNKDKAPEILKKLDSLHDQDIYIMKSPKQLQHFLRKIDAISID